MENKKNLLIKFKLPTDARILMKTIVNIENCNFKF